MANLSLEEFESVCFTVDVNTELSNIDGKNIAIVGRQKTYEDIATFINSIELPIRTGKSVSKHNIEAVFSHFGWKTKRTHKFKEKLVPKTESIPDVEELDEPIKVFEKIAEPIEVNKSIKIKEEMTGLASVLLTTLRHDKSERTVGLDDSLAQEIAKISAKLLERGKPIIQDAKDLPLWTVLEPYLRFPLRLRERDLDILYVQIDDLIKSNKNNIFLLSTLDPAEIEDIAYGIAKKLSEGETPKENVIPQTINHRIRNSVLHVIALLCQKIT